MLKNKYIYWIVAQIAIYIIKYNDSMLYWITDNMKIAALLVLIGATGTVGALSGLYSLFKMATEDESIKVYKKLEENYNEIIKENKDIKPTEFLEVRKVLKIAYANVENQLIKESIIFSCCMMTLLISLSLGYISLEDYKAAVKLYRILNGKCNDGPVKFQEWRENENQ